MANDLVTNELMVPVPSNPPTEFDPDTAPLALELLIVPSDVPINPPTSVLPLTAAIAVLPSIVTLSTVPISPPTDDPPMTEAARDCDAVIA